MKEYPSRVNDYSGMCCHPGPSCNPSFELQPAIVNDDTKIMRTFCVSIYICRDFLECQENSPRHKSVCTRHPFTAPAFLHPSIFCRLSFSFFHVMRACGQGYYMYVLRVSFFFIVLLCFAVISLQIQKFHADGSVVICCYLRIKIFNPKLSTCIVLPCQFL